MSYWIEWPTLEEFIKDDIGIKIRADCDDHYLVFITETKDENGNDAYALIVSRNFNDETIGIVHTTEELHKELNKYFYFSGVRIHDYEFV